MATFTKLKSGSWRAQIRRKGQYLNETFLRRKDAEELARETGQPAAEPLKLIVPMLERFIATDRGFASARHQCPDGDLDRS